MALRLNIKQAKLFKLTKHARRKANNEETNLNIQKDLILECKTSANKLGYLKRGKWKPLI